jgi:hypothetical protein
MYMADRGREASMTNELLIQMHSYRLNGDFDRFSANHMLDGYMKA